MRRRWDQSRSVQGCVTSHTYSTSRHLNVLSSSLAYCLTPPVGTLTSCCPVLWETSLSSWHSWQTVFWLAYAQLLLSSFPGFSPPITASISMCYLIWVNKILKSDISYKLPAFLEQCWFIYLALGPHKRQHSLPDRHSCWSICFTHMSGTETWWTQKMEN